MLAGLDAGLSALGVWAPVHRSRLTDAHAILMVLGFVAALVALERAVALARRWAYAGPLGLAVGALFQPISPLATVGGIALLVGASTLVGVYVLLWRRQRDPAVMIEAMGAVLAVGAVLLWRTGLSVPTVVPWLAGFAVLTIVGERLELARLAMSRTAQALLPVLALAFASAVGCSLLWPGPGSLLLGATLVSLTVWLVVHDVARRTVRGSGETRFMAICMLTGQAWLLVAGLIWLVGGTPTATGAYDALVHAVFLGFTMSMIMAHAPVILPAVARRPLPYHWVMYLPWGLLQTSLALRLWGGDARGWETAWQIGGIGNVLAMLGFFVVVAVSLFRGPR